MEFYLSKLVDSINEMNRLKEHELQAHTREIFALERSNALKEDELSLKERELNLREKELELEFMKLELKKKGVANSDV